MRNNISDLLFITELYYLKNIYFDTMKNLILTLSLLGAFSTGLKAADYGFEDSVPKSISVIKGGNLSLSDSYFKEGKKSLKWDWVSNSSLCLIDSLEMPGAAKSADGGITLWIYNEKPVADHLHFVFETAKGEKGYEFSFNLSYKGWRACWIKFSDMKKTQLASGKIVKMLVSSPSSVAKGSVYLDRMKITAKTLSDRITPDLQIDENNNNLKRDLWHWCRLWEWEQYKYDVSVPTNLTTEGSSALKEMEKRLDAALKPDDVNTKELNKVEKTYSAAGIARVGDHMTGKPLVSNDELQKKNGELSLTDINDMLIAFAQDWVISANSSSLKKYFEVLDYAIEQGMAYGSGMGTNHHYGYQTRDIFRSAWIMRNEIRKSENSSEYIKTLCYWSGLQESRIPYQYGRDELLDTWHTLLQAKLICAMMITEEKERYRAVQALSRWVSGSMAFTPGTIGGIKIDGTTFHHGGFYPAYSVGAFAALGNYLMVTNATPFMISESARKNFKLALQTIRNYTNLKDWGIGICGRHPFSGKIPDEDINAFAYLAQAGDLTGKGEAFDRELASDFLRFGTGNKQLAKTLRKAGVVESANPEGFWAYNYGAFGIHRRNNWMVTLKGYNTDVWNSEIYTKDNRYGRYQSYGSVQIIGSGKPVTQKESGFEENGWDWNRVPGTTTIHLPLEMLESPFKGTQMEHSPEHFAGASSLEGKNGVFAMKLLERNRPTFTPGFKARKSVFCFDNRLVCLGTGITNNNQKYPTETTLFQVALKEPAEPMVVDNAETTTFPFESEFDSQHGLICSDTKGNYYYVKNSGHVKVMRQHQRSFENKTKKLTEGDFASACLVHGTAPDNQEYEYMVLIQPDKNQLKKIGKENYSVLRKDSIVHAVRDNQTNITGYAIFEDFVSTDKSSEIQKSDRELLVMTKPVGDNQKIMSVCMPDLNISEKSYTTKESSKPAVKQITLNGNWKVALEMDNVKAVTSSDKKSTSLQVTCVDGRPVEFTLMKY
ncbi:chondroitin sulfate ABC lyase [Bacteroides sedimenti]|uniref:Chondroitin sulfate ABC lyase n=2 Tax=Bacteroides sedimenti TaxID=2136147 RepID=A0ABM8IBV5_9BACE